MASSPDPLPTVRHVFGSCPFPWTLQHGDAMPPRPASTGASRLKNTSPLTTLLILIPIYALTAYIALWKYYILPTPIAALTDDSGNAQISEAAILGYAKYLSEDIGYRVVGTTEHAQADEWMIKKAEEFERECYDVVQKTGRKLECEVWHQRGSGAHRFDMMDKHVYKTYTELTNIIVRISNGTPLGKEHALLVNAHVDSTLMTPGAADDAMPIGVMLECMRVLLADPTWEPSTAVIFLFNNAEESLQDASHLFSTRHFIADSVRAVINLEAAGTTGPELLFQATSEEMIQAYAKVPHPFGTVIAADIFKTGVMLSDTDFRQFVQYLNVSGVDMAVVSNSYLYHMRKDLVEHIEPGVAQHMAENTLSLIRTLSHPSSPLDEMSDGFTAPTSVYFSYFGNFILFNAGSATAVYAVLITLSLTMASQMPDPAPALHGSRSARLAKSLVLGGVVSLGSFVGSVLGANTLAGLVHVTGRSMSWFARPWLPIPMYAPPAFTGLLIARLILPDADELAIWTATSFLLLVSGTTIHLAGYGSGATLIFSGGPMLVGMVASSRPRLGIARYAIIGSAVLTNGVQFAATMLDVFVPLTGRIGADAPSENIVASLVSLIGAYALPLLPALVARFSRRSAARGATLCLLVTMVVTGIYLTKEPFDEMHQRRLFVVHMHNTTTGAEHLNLAGADSAAGLGSLVQSLGEHFGAPGRTVETVKMSEWESSWDVIYPFSAFIQPWTIELTPLITAATEEEEGDRVEVRALWDVIDEAKGTRSIRLEVRSFGVIWPVIAFDAHVLEWTLDNDPPKEYTRHHVKGAMFFGSDAWDMDLVLNASTSAELAVSHVGVRRRAMWPARKDDTPRDPSTDLLARIDSWVEERTRGTVDPTLVSCVGGVTVL